MAHGDGRGDLVRVHQAYQHRQHRGGAQRGAHRDLRAGGIRLLAVPAPPVVEWRAEVPSLDLLNTLVGDVLPLGLRAGSITQTFHRDLYFDAPDWTLRRRGVTCRFRVRLDDRRILTVRSLGRTEGAAVVVIPQSFEAEVEQLTGEEAVA